MTRTHLLFILALLALFGLLAAGCSPPSPVEAALQATETPTDEAAPEEEPTAAVEATAVPATMPELTPTTIELADSNCVSCHSNAEQLQLLAEEEDVPEVPSEGSG